MYRAIFVDIDGTILDNSKNLREETKLAIKKAIDNGIKVIICSGRQRYSAINFKEIGNMDRFMICTNGAEIYDCETKEVVYKSLVDIEDCQFLYKFAEENNMVIKFNFGIGRVVNKPEYLDEYEIALEEDIITFLSKNKIRQVSLASEDIKKIEELKEILKCKQNIKLANQFIWEVNGKILHAIHCTNSNVSKGNAMAGLCKFLNIDIKDVIAIGDDMNDISMIKMAGLGVAMGNADDEIKEIADMVTTSNEENGVAEILEKIVEGNI